MRITKSVSEAADEAQKMLGRTLVTHQTGPAGKAVNRIYIEDGSDIARELYLALLIDRNSSRIAFVCSTEGGMDIEEVAANTPEKVLTFTVDPASGISGFHGRRVAFALGLEGRQVKQCVDLVNRLYRLFTEKDAEMLEINPLIVTTDGRPQMPRRQDGLRLERALPPARHPRASATRPRRTPRSLRPRSSTLTTSRSTARSAAWSTAPGWRWRRWTSSSSTAREPANFLDVGGGASKEKVTEAFKIITSDPNVKGILVNIFGGIMRCDVIAEGVIAAVKEVGLQVPLVVRLEGHQRRAWEEDPERDRPRGDRRRRPGGRGREDRQGGEG